MVGNTCDTKPEGAAIVTALSKGQNAPLPTPDVVLSVEVGTAADVSALLVTPSGKVRTDNDFVFFNQPTGPGVRLVPAAGLAQLHVSTGQVPAEIDAIRRDAPTDLIRFQDAASIVPIAERPTMEEWIAVKSVLTSEMRLASRASFNL